MIYTIGASVSIPHMKLTKLENKKVSIFRCNCGKEFNVAGYPVGYKFACPKCHAFCVIFTNDDELGQGTLLGDFVIEKIIGRGGMGIVYLGHQLSLERPVAIKVLKPSAAAHKKFINRFSMEAKTAAQIIHNNIVQIYYVGREKHVFFIAMEYVDGKSIRTMINEMEKISESSAVDIILQASLGLKKAHAMNILHRDIKPDNLIVNKQGEVKVADFGLAIDLDDSKKQGVSEQIEGSPHYMAPEQVMRGECTFASDIYSLGATLYHMVTSVPPFTGSSPVSIITKHVTDYPRSPREANQKLSKKLCQVMQKMMAKRPDERFSSMEALIRQLRLLKKEQKGKLELKGTHWFIEEKNEAIRLKEMAAIVEINKVISQERNPDKLLLRIVHEITTALDAERSTLYIYEPDTREIWAKVTEGMEKGNIIRLPVGKGIAGIVARDISTELINNPYKDPHFDRSMDAGTGFKTRNMICMPILGSKVDLLGVIQVLNKKKGGFDYHDESLLSALTVHVGLTMENSIYFCSLKPKCEKARSLGI